MNNALYLTVNEEKMINGEYGEAIANAMRVIVKVGEALGADNLIPIKHAHVSGISYLTIGEPGLLFIEKTAETGVKISVYSTINPVGIQMDKWREFGVSKVFANKQLRIIRALKKMGFNETLTCTPYLIRKPSVNEHLAWGESSAVGMANTYYGAHTNREGGPLALMSAIVGETYNAGLHKHENRIPNIRVILKTKRSLMDPSIAGAVGYIVGEKAGDSLPLLEAPSQTPFSSVKAYTAAAGASGSIAMTVIPKITPGYKEILRSIKINEMEKIVVEDSEINEVVDPKNERPDIILIGCPHADMNEILRLKEALDKCKGKNIIPVWLTTSRKIFDELKEKRLIRFFNEKNIKITRDTCPVVSPYLRKGFKIVATTSSKSFFYIPRMHGVKTIVVSWSKLRDYLCG